MLITENKLQSNPMEAKTKAEFLWGERRREQRGRLEEPKGIPGTDNTVF